MIQIMAGTPQMKLLITLLTDSIVFNIGIPFFRGKIDGAASKHGYVLVENFGEEKMKISEKHKKKSSTNRRKDTDRNMPLIHGQTELCGGRIKK